MIVLEKLATTINQPQEKTMMTLKRLGAAIALTCVLAFATLADCEPPIPGIMNTPCSGAQITPDDPVTPAQPSLSSESSPADVVEISVTTINVLLSARSLF